MKVIKIVIAIPIAIMGLLFIYSLFTPTKDFDKTKYQVYNISNTYQRSDNRLQQRVREALESNVGIKESTGIQGIAATSKESVDKISDNADLEKLANWFNNKATGPCSGLGQYIVAKAQELNISPFLAVAIPGTESTWGAACVKQNNFAGLTKNGGGFASFDTPEECVDRMLADIAGYRDKAEFGNIDITNLTALGHIYCTPPEPWVASTWNLIDEASNATGVQIDIRKE